MLLFQVHKKLSHTFFSAASTEQQLHVDQLSKSNTPTKRTRKIFGTSASDEFEIKIMVLAQRKTPEPHNWAFLPLFIVGHFSFEKYTRRGKSKQSKFCSITSIKQPFNREDRFQNV